MFIIPDLDIDVNQLTQEDLLSKLQHISASKINDKGINPHGVGVYFSNIPKDNITNLASIDYKSAEEDFGYIKYDILHNSVYDDFNSRTELFEIMKKDINWDNLYNAEILKTLPHIGNYYTLINQLPKIDSILKLAMFISILRPGKKYLIDTVKETKSWDSIKDIIWKKEGDAYMYKKSHAISYALMITIALRKT